MVISEMIYTVHAPRSLLIIPTMCVCTHVSTHPTPLPRSASLFTEETHNTAAQHSLLFLPLCHSVALFLFSELYSSDFCLLLRSLNTGMAPLSCPPLKWMQNIKHDLTRVSCWGEASTFSVYSIQRDSSTKTLSWTFRNENSLIHVEER